MEFTDKLTRLTAGKSKIKFAKAAKLPGSAISNYISKEQMPRGDKALALARVLNVPLDWLLDDSQDWPPPPVSTLSAASTRDLAAELGRRMLGVGNAMMAKTMQATGEDWIKIANELLSADIDAPLTKRLREVAELPSQLNSLEAELRNYDPRSAVGETPKELGLEADPEYELSLIDLWIYHRHVQEKPGYEAAAQLASLWLIPEKYRSPQSFPDFVKHMRAMAAEELKKQPASRPPKKFWPSIFTHSKTKLGKKT